MKKIKNSEAVGEEREREREEKKGRNKIMRGNDIMVWTLIIACQKV